MNFVDFLFNNYELLFELIGLGIILFISVHVPSKIRHYTRMAIILLIISTAAYNLELWTQSFDKLNMWRAVFTGIKYSVFPVVLMYLIQIVAYVDRPILRKLNYILIIPWAVSVPIFFTTQWTHIICYYTEDNVYMAGTIPYLPYIIFGLYLLIFVIQNIVYLKFYSNRDKIIAIYISLASFFFVIFYLIYKSNENIDFTTIFTASLVFYFLFIYIHMSSIDPLTGLKNRQSYYQQIEIDNGRIIAVVSIDMNELKYINDSYGHDKGDDAIVSVAKIIREYSGPQKLVYRVGGDEFIIFYRKGSKEEIEEKIKKMRDEVANAGYICSFGYTFKDNNTLNEMIKIADKNMYEDKQAVKKEILENGGVLHPREDQIEINE